MTHATDPPRRFPGKVVLCAILLLAAAGYALWRGTADGRDLREMPAVCARCGHTTRTQVGPTPGAEPWPRPCPACGQPALYPARPCPACRRSVPLKDPQADRLGVPVQCPSCKRSWFET